MSARTRELLIGAGLAHVIAPLDRVVVARGFSGQLQEYIALQLIETEAMLECERGGLQYTEH